MEIGHVAGFNDKPAASANKDAFSRVEDVLLGATVATSASFVVVAVSGGGGGGTLASLIISF
jgi:hypothetical protein